VIKLAIICQRAEKEDLGSREIEREDKKMKIGLSFAVEVWNPRFIM
jgi:hypothetical protein